MGTIMGIRRGGGSGCTLTVTGVAGDVVTVANSSKTYTRTLDSSGQAVFKGLTDGEWTVTMTNGVETTTETVNIVADYTLELGYNTPPTYTYTGEASYVDEGDGNWHLKLLTSGNLTFTNLGNAKELEVFLVGGGAGGTNSGGGGGNLCPGGGGGYVNNGAFAPQKNIAYAAVIGAGAGSGADGTGGTTTIFELTANGGAGVNGGSGGGAGSPSSGGTGGDTGGAGGTNGGNGNPSAYGGGGWGTGAGVTTIPWGDETKYGRYAGGGGGGGGYEDYGGAGGSGGGGKGGNSNSNGTAGSVNTGGGGGGGGYGGNGGAGGSGIILIRNKRMG